MHSADYVALNLLEGRLLYISNTVDTRRARQAVVELVALRKIQREHKEALAKLKDAGIDFTPTIADHASPS